MPNSYLQDEFLRVFADGHRATVKRILSRLASLGIQPELQNQFSVVVRDEVRGLYHGSLVVFDSGSSLADHGVIKIVDVEGAPFMNHLHEIGFMHYDECT